MIKRAVLHHYDDDMLETRIFGDRQGILGANSLHRSEGCDQEKAKGKAMRCEHA
jgi:hypothetical protein